MTKEEMIAALEGLKDLVNDNGKHQLNTLKAAISQGLEESAPAVKESEHKDSKHHSGLQGRAG